MTHGSKTNREKRKGGRSLIVNAALTLIAFVLLAMAITSNRSQIQEVLSRRIDARLLGLAFFVYLSALLLTFLLVFACTALGLPFRLRDAMRLGISSATSSTSSSQRAGGNLSRQRSCAGSRTEKPRPSHPMVIDRALGLLGCSSWQGFPGFSHGRSPRRASIAWW